MPDPMLPVADPSVRAIVFADLAESVRLQREHEWDTVARWRDFAAEVRAALPARHRGQVVRTEGDAVLAHFPGVPEALQAAFALHAMLAQANVGVAPGAALWLRVGVHVAPVVVDPHDIYGAGVNLAARLAGLAQPGETVMSIEARQAVVDGVQADVHDLGLRFVKHVEVPVRAFGACPPGGPATPMPRPPDEDLRPRIAVVPFVSLPADPAHDALGFAMADDIIASLARHPELRVLSRSSTAALRGVDVPWARVRDLLDATFMLSGTFYVRNDGVRLNAELCELRHGEVLWTGSSTAVVDEIFAGRDELVPQIVSQLARHVMAHEIGRVRSLPMTALASYSLYLGACGLMNSLLPDDFAAAANVLQHLRERHPRQAAPSAMLARWHVNKVVQGWTQDLASEAEAARGHAQAAIAIDPGQSAAHSALALVRVNFDRDLDGGVADNLRAIERDPQDPVPWAQLAGARTLQGEFRDAVEAAHHALALSPLDPQRFLFESYAAMAHLAAGQHAEAARLARQSVRRHARHAPSHRILIGALWLGDEPQASRQAAQAYLKDFPHDRAGGVQRFPMAPREAWRAAFQQALVAAGVPP